MTRLCSVRGCGQPHHARGWCTRRLRNMMRHGSLEAPPRPQEGYTARLSADQVREIRSSKGSVTARVLAERFGVTEDYVYQIWGRLYWRHI